MRWGTALVAPDIDIVLTAEQLIAEIMLYGLSGGHRNRCLHITSNPNNPINTITIDEAPRYATRLRQRPVGQTKHPDFQGWDTVRNAKYPALFCLVQALFDKPVDNVTVTPLEQNLTQTKNELNSFPANNDDLVVMSCHGIRYAS